MTAAIERVPDSSATPVVPGRPSGAGSWPLFAAAAGLLLVENGRYTIGVASWVGPAILLRFLQGSRTVVRLALAGALLTAVFVFQFGPMIPLPAVILAPVALGYGVAGLLPYAVHRALAARLGGFRSTLVFPCAWVVIELAESFSPYSTWGSLAYTQYGFLPLMQLASVTGLYGISFLMAWFAAVLAWAWERGFDWATIRRGALLYTVVLLVVLVMGGGRLVLFPPGSQTVRVASLSRPDVEVRYRSDGQLDATGLRRVRQAFGDVSEELLRRSRREAETGARIVLWGEDDAHVLVEDEPDLIARASRVARETGAYLAVSAKVWRRGAPRPWEKKLVLLGPDGAVAWSYRKSLLLPGNETPGVEPGDGHLRFASTPYGTVSGAICFEADAARFLRQAGQGRADVVLIPGDDSRELDPWHAQMAVFRAVEQGFNIVRHANEGLSIATDYQGRVRATMDHFETASSDRVMVAQLPTRGVRTVYSRVGDLFAYLAVAGLGLLALIASRRRSPGVRG